MSYIGLALFGAYSIIVANKALSGPGISGMARTLVLKRHATNILIFIVANLYTWAFSIYICFSIPLDKFNNPWWKIILKVLFYAQGIVSPLVRLQEPAFRITIKQTIIKDLRMFLCLKETDHQDMTYSRSTTVASSSETELQGDEQVKQEAKEVKKDAEMAPLFLFLASSLNVELVYIILKGIVSFTYIKGLDE